VLHRGSRTSLVMQMVHLRRTLTLASPSRAFALTSATLSRSRADPVLFLVTKQVREPVQLANFPGEVSWRAHLFIISVTRHIGSLLLRETLPPCSSAEGPYFLRSPYQSIPRLLIINRGKIPNQQITGKPTPRQINPFKNHFS
jgi:hypothetical protein